MSEMFPDASADGSKFLAGTHLKQQLSEFLSSASVQCGTSY